MNTIPNRIPARTDMDRALAQAMQRSESDEAIDFCARHIKRIHEVEDENLIAAAFADRVADAALLGCV